MILICLLCGACFAAGAALAWVFCAWWIALLITFALVFYGLLWFLMGTSANF